MINDKERDIIIFMEDIYQMLNDINHLDDPQIQLSDKYQAILTHIDYIKEKINKVLIFMKFANN